MKPRKRKRSCQKWVVTTASVGYLITEHMATEVKLVGLVFRLNYGSGERCIALIGYKMNKIRIKHFGPIKEFQTSIPTDSGNKYRATGILYENA